MRLGAGVSDCLTGAKSATRIAAIYGDAKCDNDGFVEVYWIRFRGSPPGQRYPVRSPRLSARDDSEDPQLYARPASTILARGTDAAGNDILGRSQHVHGR